MTVAAVRKSTFTLGSTIWRHLLVFSLVANVALAMLSFVVWPLWKAAAVGAAMATTKAQAEIAERKAVSKAKAKEQAEARAQRTVAIANAVAATTAQATVEQRAAVAAARAEEKAKGRVRRMAVAVPALGAVTAGAFEYFDYREWQEDNPDGDIKEYASETIEVSKSIVDEVFDELPDGPKPDVDSMLERYDVIIEKISIAETVDWATPDFLYRYFSWE